ncbi:MAG: helix-turn-helix domain-containing protein [Methylotenera sp.]|uniref:helix-turn-helix domain-containing protein n=1 Tax=Methylotenera sp. TaxID=2051956 RepID=UPI002489DAFA|nr:helix-turn-helix domain-containing protein [Methylotenera sp.]MDI1307886.1 helix-turn-helix domain-containing protein [Methylotenera sp.]
MANNDSAKRKGLATLTTNPKAKTTQSKFTDNSALNQRLKLLDYLLEHGSISTSEAREKLDIYYPPARAFELKRDGYQILTIWNSWTSEHGIQHRIGRYVLTQKHPLDCEA